MDKPDQTLSAAGGVIALIMVINGGTLGLNLIRDHQAKNPDRFTQVEGEKLLRVLDGLASGELDVRAIVFDRNGHETSVQASDFVSAIENADPDDEIRFVLGRRETGQECRITTSVSDAVRLRDYAELFARDGQMPTAVVENLTEICRNIRPTVEGDLSAFTLNLLHAPTTEIDGASIDLQRLETRDGMLVPAR